MLYYVYFNNKLIGFCILKLNKHNVSVGKDLPVLETITRAMGFKDLTEYVNNIPGINTEKADSIYCSGDYEMIEYEVKGVYDHLQTAYLMFLLRHDPRQITIELLEDYKRHGDSSLKMFLILPTMKDITDEFPDIEYENLWFCNDWVERDD